ncbi:Aerobic-type carbon monoxide dehydrogenase, small subunit, CoxS/CutS family [Streptomyces sp. yr375]|uniref:2Fe-2S iron-sulfur cluster-binding protein n=1 Tax=Streptomyces sp. yr375 TaxID=1761906 RepID=UPI0008D8A73B|nr:2Fe-2S iron-sulfur cluster-binding protein [Streptomyces sp. yr375]SEQ28586.1 Aerobic-type carbon monoxide dehydrogenase, small subunit, CoxS/CutS family [Streptomyces sp. yr375]
MTDDQQGHGHGQETEEVQGAPQGGGRWDPLPQGDYDDGATAFVKFPEGGIDALLAGRGDSPLAAPGHGYVPPQIAVAPEPDTTGTWAAPAGGGDWPAPQGTPQTVGDDRFTYHPGATGQWSFDDTSAAQGAPQSAPAPGHDVTGQWSIPVAGGDLPDESGEFTTSALVEQWGGTPPATLPGGAPAPWATDPTATSGQGWALPTDEAGPAAHQGQAATEAPAFGHAPEHGHEHAHGHEHGHTGTFAPEVSAEAYTVSPDGPAEAAGRPSEATGVAEASGDPERAHEAAHELSEPAGPAEPVGAAHEAALDGASQDPEPETEPTADTAPDAAPVADAADVADAVTDAVAGTDVVEASSEDAPPPFHEEHPLAAYVLRVNGSERPVTDAWIGESLLYVLRERLGLAGAKDGCSQGECGACNVQVDGRLVASCLVPAVTTAGSEIRTVEGLAVDGQPSDVQRALARCGAVQCGFCVPGMAMTVHDLLEGNPAPSELEARQALCGNLCRCSGYRGVLQAVQDVVAEREAHAAADAETDGDEARIPHQAGPGAGGIHASAFENPAQPHPHDPAYGQGQDGGQA